MTRKRKVPKNLNDRVIFAKYLAMLGKVMNRNRQEQATKVTVPGSEAKSYDVILRRDSGLITGECLLNQSGHGHENCKGYAHGFVCRHILAATMIAMDEAGYKATFRSKRESFKDDEVVYRLSTHAKARVNSRTNEVIFFMLKNKGSKK